MAERFYIYHQDLGKPQLLKVAPDGWSEPSGKTRRRDSQSHGVFFEYTNRLKFVKDGRNIIAFFFEKYGVEAELILIRQKKSVRTRKYETKYVGKFNLTSLRLSTLYAECNIEQTGFVQKFKNRQDVKVDLKSLLTQSGKAITPNANETENIELHSKVIRKVYVASQQQGIGLNGDLAEASAFVQLCMDTEELDEITERFTFPWAITGAVPVNMFKFTEACEVTFNLRAEASRLERTFTADEEDTDTTLYHIRSLGGTIVNPLGGSHAGGNLTMYVKKNAEASIAWTRADVVGIPPPVLGLTVFGSTVFTYNGTITFQKDDILTIYGDITTTFDVHASSVTLGSSLVFWGSNQPTEVFVPVKAGNQFSDEQTLQTVDFGAAPSADPKPSRFNITADTVFPATTVPMFLKHEAIARVVESITDEPDSFRSEYYGRVDSEPTAYDADGAGSLRGIIGGKLARGFPLATNSTFISFKEIAQSCAAIDGVHVGIERDGLKERVRMEPLVYFYKPKRLVQFPFVKDVEKHVADEYLYNELEAGYEKSLNEEVNNLDEFNTRKEFILPLTQVKNRLVLKSVLLGSGATLEMLRRDSYIESSTKDNDRDNDNFIVQLRRESGELVTDRDQDFAELVNIIKSETVYNAKLSVMRNIMRNGMLIRAGLVHHEEKFIKLTFGEANNEFKSRLTTETELVDEKSIQIKKLQKPLWLPEKYLFQFKPSEEQNNILDTDPYGYIEFSDTDKNWKRGFLLESKPEDDSDLTQFTLLRANI